MRDGGDWITPPPSAAQWLVSARAGRSVPCARIRVLEGGVLEAGDADCNVVAVFAAEAWLRADARP